MVDIIAVQTAEIAVLVAAGVIARRYDMRQCMLTALLGTLVVAAADCLLFSI